MAVTCNKCAKHGLSFISDYELSPTDYIEGKRNADILIVGLNPRNPVGTPEIRTLDKFESFTPQGNPYLKDFNKVSQPLFDNYNSPNSRVAHTDLVKCFSNSFPPKITKDEKEIIVDSRVIIDNCKVHLMNQIIKMKPKVIICNGSPVSWEIIDMFPPSAEVNRNTVTSYQTTLTDTGHKFWVILSGFIGRIDDRNKRRLGVELEEILQREDIVLK
jgi:uracil-DNA glycosylase